MIRFGKRVRALRLREGLTQAAMAERLGISASYLNLIEHDRRPLTTELLVRLASAFQLDVRAFAAEGSGQLVADLVEVFGDPVFEEHPLTKRDIADFVAGNPDVARAVRRLHEAYASARRGAEALAERMLDVHEGDSLHAVDTMDRATLSSEQVTAMLQRWQNHVPALEEEAERLTREAQCETESLFPRLARHLERRHGVTVRIATVGEMAGAVRRFDPARKELLLSEILRRGSRNFQLASQIGLLECGDTIEALLDRETDLHGDDTRRLARVALAGYFAGAVLMPYEEFRKSAEDLRWDVELLGHRFRVSFEQTCHRLTTLRRPGAEGVPFFLVRVDLAGNISKKLGAAGVRFPRFSGLCSLWNVHAAFLQPGMVRVQVSRMPDGTGLFSIARTVRRHGGDYRAPNVLYAIAIGCDLQNARRLVYADGIDLESATAAVPVGITCRACERMDCKARAFPPVHAPLTIDENVRGVSFYAPAPRLMP